MHRPLPTIVSACLAVVFAPFLMGTGCEPTFGPSVMSDTGIRVSFTDRETYVAETPLHALGARVFVAIDEGESTRPTMLTSLTPDLIAVEPTEGGYFLDLLSAGEGEVLVHNDCPHLDGCEATFVVPVVSPSLVRWVGPFLLTRGGWGRGTVILEYEASLVQGDEVIAPVDGWAVRNGQTLMLRAPETGDELLVEVLIGDESHVLSVEVVDLDRIFDFQLRCHSAGCEVVVEDVEGVRIEGAPLEWSFEGTILEVPPTSAGAWWLGDGNGAGCELCVSVPGTVHRRCETVSCTPGELLP